MHSTKRKCLLGLLVTFSCLYVNSQNVSVKSFQLLETDLTANFKETQEIDQNGEVAALIKVITTETGFMFDVGALGIVRQVQQPGEIWLYVPHGVQRISINHQKLGRLEEPYYFPIPIQAARTYELVLTSSRMKTIVEEDAGGAFLALKVTPSSANVYVDNQVRALNAEGMLSLFLPYGEHSYRVEAFGYKPETGNVNIVSDETQAVTVSLTSTMARLTLSTSMPDAEIWVNNEQKGIGRWTGELAAGTYVVESRKAGHRSRRATLTLAENDEQTTTIPDPEPIVGRLRAESDPLEAEVWLGDKKLGTTPRIFSDILAGNHVLRFAKEGYISQTVDVTIEESKIATASVTLQKDAATIRRENEAENEARKKAVVPNKPTPTRPTSSLLPKSYLYLDAHYTSGNPSAIGGSVGVYLGGFNIEGSFDKALGKGVEVLWYELSDGVYYPFNITHTPSSLFSGCAGYGIHVGSRVRLTPRVGAGVLTIKGVGDLSQKTYVFSGSASLRAEFAIARLLSLYVAPTYNIPLKRGETAEYLIESIPDSDLAQWNKGFSLCVGVSF